MRLSTWLLLAALLASCGSERRPRRVVLVTLDTLRYDSFDATMPATRAIAEGGVIFDGFYSATSTTQPTHATLFTGLHPWQHAVPRNGAILPQSAETLAERFQAAGYRTAAVAASFPLERRFGFDQGFDVYRDDFEHFQANQWNEFEVGGAFYSLADKVTDKALEELDGAGEGDQFLWFHYYDPHAPYGDTGGGVSTIGQLYDAAKRGRKAVNRAIQVARAGYDRDVAFLDRALARVLERVLADSDRFETHVLVTADHGESFGEDNSFGHGKRLTRSQVHIPTFLLSPGVSARRDANPAGTIDIPATLLALSGLPSVGNGAGWNLLDAGPHRPAVMGMRRAFLEPFEDTRADGQVEYVQGARFYVVHEGALHIGDKDGVESETGATDAALAAELAVAFSVFEGELTGQEVEDVAHDPAALEALKHLGY